MRSCWDTSYFHKLFHLFTHGKLGGLQAKRSRLLVAELYWHLRVDCSSQITSKMYLFDTLFIFYVQFILKLCIFLKCSEFARF